MALNPNDSVMLVLGALDGEVHGKTKLVKMLYLAELNAHATKKKALSSIKFKSYYYGPYSDDIDGAFSRLEREGLVETKSGQTMDGHKYYIYSLTNKGGRVFGELKQKNCAEFEVLRKTVDKYKDMPLKSLLTQVYGTKPYKNADFGEDITF